MAKQQKRTTLTPRQYAAVVAVCSKPTLKAAAKSAKVGLRTLHKWMKVPEFKREVERAMRATFEQSLRDLQRISGEAVKTLAKNLKCKDASVEVRAAKVILDKAINGQAVEDLRREVEELRSGMERDDEPRGNPKPDPAAAGGGGRPTRGEGVRGDAGVAEVGPDCPVLGDGMGGGPVAGEVPGGPEPAAGDAVLPPGGEERDVGGEDFDALFDPP